MNATSKARKHRTPIKWKRILNGVVLWAILLIFFIPALWIILTSVRSRAAINAHPPI